MFTAFCFACFPDASGDVLPDPADAVVRPRLCPTVFFRRRRVGNPALPVSAAAGIPGLAAAFLSVCRTRYSRACRYGFFRSADSGSSGTPTAEDAAASGRNGKRFGPVFTKTESFYKYHYTSAVGGNQYFFH